MAAALATLPGCDVTDTSTQAARWKEWLSRFRNLLVPMNITDTLTQLLDDGRAMELSQKQVANREESQTINK